MKETESRLLFRWEEFTLDGGRTIDDWRGPREVVAEGEERAEGCRTLGVAPSSLSITPNSLVEKLDGEALVDEVGNPLVLLVANTDPECFSVGEGIPDKRLEIRGILVGVSLGSPIIELFNDGGGSRPSCRVCELLVPVVPTEGLPAIVGS
jgi:hypothetical protein